MATKQISKKDGSQESRLPFFAGSPMPISSLLRAMGPAS
jgi:hypothetical protein